MTLDEIMTSLYDAHSAIAKLSEQHRAQAGHDYDDVDYCAISVAMQSVSSALDALRIVRTLTEHPTIGR